MNVPFQPKGYPTASPYLFIDGASAAIDFYSNVFGAVERMRLPGPDDVIMHAELDLGDSLIMIADEFPEMNALSPKSVGGSPVSIGFYTEDVDATVAKAVAAGATVERPVEDQFYGDRSGSIVDPFGHRWTVATHIEDMTPDEMAERFANMMKGG